MKNAEAIITTLTGAIHQTITASHIATLEQFEGFPNPQVKAREANEQLHQFASAHHAAIGLLLRDVNGGTRHLAAFALGFSKDVRRIEPLIGLLDDQQDRFDHDYAYEALRELGALALAPLYEIAIQDGERAVQATHALGQSKADSLPWLKRLVQTKGLSPAVFIAYYNRRDPEGLLDLECALWTQDTGVKNDALDTIESLLQIAWESSHEILNRLSRRKWSDRMVELLDHDDVSDTGTVLLCIGYLGNTRHMNVLTNALNDDESVEAAIAALGCFRSKQARKQLERLLDSPSLESACQAAYQLAKDCSTPNLLRGRAQHVMLRGLMELEGTRAWCDAAAELPSSPGGRQVLFDCMRGADLSRAKALDAILFNIGRGNTLEAWLVDCPPSLADFIRRATKESFPHV